MLPEELVFHLRSLSRLIFYVTDEEDRFFTDLDASLKTQSTTINCSVFNSAWGDRPLGEVVRIWQTRECRTGMIQDFVHKAFTDDTKNCRNYYVITDPDRWLADPDVVRGILNVTHQSCQDMHSIKTIILVGSALSIPEKLARYTEVVHDPGPSDKVLTDTVNHACEALRLAPPDNIPEVFKGLTVAEVVAAIAQATTRIKIENGNKNNTLPIGGKVKPEHITQFRDNRQYITQSEGETFETAQSADESTPLSAELAERQTRIDPEILNLVTAMNTIDGVLTHNSCCGHGERGGVRVWFYAESVKTLYPLARLIDPRYGGSVPLWTISVEDSDSEVEGQPGICGVNFCLRSTDEGPAAYEQGEKLAQRIHNFWESAEKYGHDYGVYRRDSLVEL